jgi:hypothetical protein
MMETFENVMSDRRAFEGISDLPPNDDSPMVDIDLNLLKNLLESHASQIGLIFIYKYLISHFLLLY